MGPAHRHTRKSADSADHRHSLGSNEMKTENVVGHTGKRGWTSPDYRRISAGSAEAGAGTFGDAGGPGANRS